MKEAIICMWLILQLCATEGVPPPGLTSLKKCNDFYNLGVPVKNFTPLTKEELDRINKNELFYQPVDGYAGGVKALPTQLPFMAALGYDNDGQKEFLCGGTLISEEFVLTAAHCIHSRAGGRIKYIRLGDLNLKNSSDDAEAQEFQLKEVYVHPEYKSPIKYHDIALVKLDRPAVLTEHVSPACLEPKRVDINNMIFDAAGWGQLGYGEEASNHLQVGTLRHYQGAECQQTFGKDHTIPEGVKPEFQICAGAYAHLADTCELNFLNKKLQNIPRIKIFRAILEVLLHIKFLLKTLKLYTRLLVLLRLEKPAPLPKFQQSTPGCLIIPIGLRRLFGPMNLPSLIVIGYIFLRVKM